MLVVIVSNLVIVRGIVIVELIVMCCHPSPFFLYHIGLLPCPPLLLLLPPLSLSSPPLLPRQGPQRTTRSCLLVLALVGVGSLVTILGCLIATVLCWILSVLVGVALLHILGIDAKLGQVAVVGVVVVFAVDNRVPIVVVVIFAAATCCCCSHHPRRMMTIRQAVEAVAATQRGSLCQGSGSSSGDSSCASRLHTALDCNGYQIACSGACSRGQVYTTLLTLRYHGNTHVLMHYAHINCGLYMCPISIWM